MKQRAALVTGASSGLGEELARLFARDGHPVVLVARREDNLRALADELSSRHGVPAHVLAADLADPGAPEALFERVRALGLEVDYLVNNAGFGSQGALLDQPLSIPAEMIEVNVGAVVKLTHLFAGPMRARGFGRVLNIASTAAFQAGPGMATYFATKAFVLSFSQAVADELKGTGVTVTCHCPGAVATGFAARAGTQKSLLFKLTVAKREVVAAHAYRAMHAGKVVVVHGLFNSLGVFAARLSPLWLTRWAAGRMSSPA